MSGIFFEYYSQMEWVCVSLLHRHLCFVVLDV